MAGKIVIYVGSGSPAVADPRFPSLPFPSPILRFSIDLREESHQHCCESDFITSPPVIVLLSCLPFLLTAIFLCISHSQRYSPALALVPRAPDAMTQAENEGEEETSTTTSSFAGAKVWEKRLPPRCVLGCS